MKIEIKEFLTDKFQQEFEDNFGESLEREYIFDNFEDFLSDVPKKGLINYLSEFCEKELRDHTKKIEAGLVYTGRDDNGERNYIGNKEQWKLSEVKK